MQLYPSLCAVYFPARLTREVTALLHFRPVRCMSMILRENPLNRQEEEVVRLREIEKMTYPEIGRKFGVSAKRVHQIYKEAKVRRQDFEEHGEEAMTLLPAKVQKFLRDSELESREKVRMEMAEGRLSWDEKQRRVRWGKGPWGRRNVGWKSWLVLLQWAGLPMPDEIKQVRCPHCGKMFTQ